MKPLKLMIIAGTRPEIIKLSKLIQLCQNNSQIKLIFVHSGQHYDNNMMKIFIEELNLPQPQYQINLEPESNSVQTGKMLISFYEIIKKEHPDIIVAQGDTNTVFAAALSAFKNNIPFGHIEAGIRSFDMTMPEEVNRMLTSVCTLLHFAPTERAVINLLNEGINPKKIYLTGNTIVDAVYENIKIANNISTIEKELKINEGDKIVLITLHRPSNVDSKTILTNIFNEVKKLEGVKIICPLHPRTRKSLENFGLLDKIRGGSLLLTEPVGYFEFLKLLSISHFIITDSGGIQEETTILKKPCLTLRENTERPESVEAGGNLLIGNEFHKIKEIGQKLINDPKFYQKMIPQVNPFGDGTSSQKIIDILLSEYAKGNLIIESSSFLQQIPFTKLVNYHDDKKITILEFEQQNSCQILELFDENGSVLIPRPDYIITKGTNFIARFMKH